LSRRRRRRAQEVSTPRVGVRLGIGVIHHFHHLPPFPSTFLEKKKMIQILGSKGKWELLERHQPRAQPGKLHALQSASLSCQILKIPKEESEREIELISCIFEGKRDEFQNKLWSL